MCPAFRDAFTILEVEDIAASLALYTGQLGFEIDYQVGGEPGAPAFAQLKLAGGGTLGLAAAPRPAQSRSTAIWLYTDDVDTAFEHLRDAGAPVVEEPADQAWGERVASVADPDGYTVHIGAPS